MVVEQAEERIDVNDNQQMIAMPEMTRRKPNRKMELQPLHPAAPPERALLPVLRDTSLFAVLVKHI